jgi:hypothetical protein
MALEWEQIRILEERMNQVILSTAISVIAGVRQVGRLRGIGIKAGLSGEAKRERS